MNSGSMTLADPFQEVLVECQQIIVDAAHQLGLIIEGVEMPLDAQQRARKPEEAVQREPDGELAALVALAHLRRESGIPVDLRVEMLANRLVARHVADGALPVGGGRGYVDLWMGNHDCQAGSRPKCSMMATTPA